MRERIAAVCDLCEGEIYWGEDYFIINGERICGECISEAAVALVAPFRVRGGDE